MQEDRPIDDTGRPVAATAVRGPGSARSASARARGAVTALAPLAVVGALAALPSAALAAPARPQETPAAVPQEAAPEAGAAGALAAARRHLASGERTAVVDLLEPLLATAAPPAEARTILAAAYLDLGRAADAALVLAPLAAPGAATPDAEALFLAARAALALGRADQAQDLLVRSAALEPVSFAAVLLADLRSQQGRVEEAAALLAPVAAALDEVAGGDRGLGAHIALQYGRILAALGRRDEAIDHLRRAAELTPTTAAAWRLLGETLVELGAIDEARRALERAQELEQAEHVDEVAAAARRRRLEELIRAAAGHREAGRPDESLAALRQAIEIDPEALQPRLLEVRLLAGLERTAEAAERADVLVRRAPDHPDVRHLRGMLRLAAGDAAGAEADFRRALAVAADHLGAGNGLAMALVALGRPEEAAAAVDRVLARWPDDPVALRTRQRLGGAPAP